MLIPGCGNLITFGNKILLTAPHHFWKLQIILIAPHHSANSVLLGEEDLGQLMHSDKVAKFYLRNVHNRFSASGGTRGGWKEKPLLHQKSGNTLTSFIQNYAVYRLRRRFLNMGKTLFLRRRKTKNIA